MIVVAKVIQSNTGKMRNETVLIFFQLLIIINNEIKNIPVLPTNPPYALSIAKV
jgi:hypothetical protein